MRLFLIVVFAAILAVDLGTALTVEKYEVDAHAKYSKKEHYERNTLEGPFIVGTKNATLQLLDFAERNDEAITALSTLLIAIFTIVLAIATKRLQNLAERERTDTEESLRISHNAANAARDFANGLVNANIPFLDPVMLMDRSNIRNVPATPDFRPGVVYRFRNYGRSPATIIEFSDYFIVLQELPQTPIYPPRPSDMPDREMVIAPNSDSRDIPCRLVSNTETWDERRMTPDQFRAERQPFFLIGRVIYDDVFGFRHTKGYCWRFDVTPAGQLQFRPFGDQPYNQRSKEKSPYAQGS